MSTNQDARVKGVTRPLGWLGLSLCGAVTIAAVLGFSLMRPTASPPGSIRHESLPDVATVEVDQGDVSLVVTETGVLESSVDDVVRCRVESLLGLPVGTPLSGGASSPSPRRTTRAGGSSAVSAKNETARTAVARAMTSAKSRLAERPGEAPLAASSRAPDSRSEGKSAAGNSATGTSVNSNPPFDFSTPLNRDAIRSFHLVVEPYAPVRSTLPDQGAMAITAPSPLSIISILEEGTRVKTGDVVCELDSSALRDALTVQKLRFAQSKAWVEQAQYALEADQVALREYEAGVLPQDIELVRQNIGICQTQRDQAARNLTWARRMLAKGYRTAAQVNADAAALEQTSIALRNAEGMLEQLVKFTGKRIIKARKARLEAIHADLLSLQSAFRLEQQRKQRIETMVANCTLRAPRDGIIVYANPSRGSQTADTQIREGLIVHPMQPIFQLLDPKHLQVRARINESQVARIRPGQPVLIHLAAFPGHSLRGAVDQVVPIPSLAGPGYSDVRSFYATVRILSGAFDALTTGLTAEVAFLVETRRHVTRVPLESVRWIGDRSFAAAIVSATTGEDWQWQPIALGATDTNFAEVIKGLAPGDRVVAHSETLPASDLDIPAPDPALDLALEGKD